MFFKNNLRLCHAVTHVQLLEKAVINIFFYYNFYRHHNIAKYGDGNCESIITHSYFKS